MANLITSRIEWSASLDPTKAQVPTEETKYHRKVGTIVRDRRSLFFLSHSS